MTLKAFAFRLLAAAVPSYAVLFAANIVLFRHAHRAINPTINLRHMFMADEQTGYRMTPNRTVVYADGFVRQTYRINSEGFRDEEPAEFPKGRRILLLGDSFTFGSCLSDDERIDRQVERLSNGAIDAYNLGVEGYGTPAILCNLRRQPNRHATDVVYLFFGNDLRRDNLDPSLGLTVFDGYLVPRVDPHGRPYSRRMLTEKVRHALAPQKRPAQSWQELLGLKHLRGILALRQRFRAPEEPKTVPEQRELLAGGEGHFSAKGVAKAVRWTMEMKEEAEARNMKFHVLVIPTKGEAQYGQYARITAGFVDELKRRGVHVVEYLDSMSSKEHYLAHDPHINGAGARRTAEAILKGLGV